MPTRVGAAGPTAEGGSASATTSATLVYAQARMRASTSPRHAGREGTAESSIELNNANG